MDRVSAQDCLFCKIAQGKMGTGFLYEDDKAVAFRDINPKAPVHVLVVPKQHIESLAMCEEKTDEPLLGHLLMVVKTVAHTEKLTKNGYRIALNVGAYGGQTVPHLHFHVLGGRALGWPPG
jgi:histidine triad (HIT) family protein